MSYASPPAVTVTCHGITTRYDDIACTPVPHSIPGTKTRNAKATVWDFNNWSQNADMLVNYAQELAKIDLRGFERNVKSAAANGATGRRHTRRLRGTYCHCRLWTTWAYMTDANLISISAFNGWNDLRTGFGMFVLAQDIFVVQNSLAVVWAVERPCFAQFYTPARQLEELIERWLPSFFMKAGQNQRERIRIALIGYKFGQPIAFGCRMK